MHSAGNRLWNVLINQEKWGKMLNTGGHGVEGSEKQDSVVHFPPRVGLVGIEPLSVVAKRLFAASFTRSWITPHSASAFPGVPLLAARWPLTPVLRCERECVSVEMRTDHVLAHLGQQGSTATTFPALFRCTLLVRRRCCVSCWAAEPELWPGVKTNGVCASLQVVVALCLWSTDVSRAYVFQASRPVEGGDSPPSHTKGEISPNVINANAA